MKVKELPTHYVIPDTQVKSGVPTDHLGWIGKDILRRRPEVVIHLGDHWDMPSLSSYDKGTTSAEGRRYQDDIEAGNTAIKLITGPTERYNKNKPADKQYKPRWVFLHGNHENRISRAMEADPAMYGKISLDDLDLTGWEVHPFLKPVYIDGVAYAHYFYQPMTGKAYGGQAATRLKTIGYSFTMGHQQVLDYAMRPVGKGMQHALIAGACYQHDEEYKGYQGNAHWRGVVICHAVKNGSYNAMFLDLAYLENRYGAAKEKKKTKPLNAVRKVIKETSND